MKNKRAIRWILPLLLCVEGHFCAVAQDTLTHSVRIPREITDAFRVGNSRIIKKWLSDRTLISIEGKSKLYAPTQAQVLLKKFFSDHPPITFEPIHQGISKKETGKREQPLLYYIAIYQSKETYRAYMLVKQSNQKFYIRSIFLDKQ